MHSLSLLAFSWRRGGGSVLLSEGGGGRARSAHLPAVGVGKPVTARRPLTPIGGRAQHPGTLLAGDAPVMKMTAGVVFAGLPLTGSAGGGGGGGGRGSRSARPRPPLRPPPPLVWPKLPPAAHAHT